MSQSKTFHLPDLGEGLPDATIVEWFVKVGDSIGLDEPLVSMETAKAVVEVPSPVSGKVLKLAGGPGDVIVTGTMLAEFEIDPSQPQRAEGQDTGHHHGAHAPAGKGVGTQDPAPDDRVVASTEGGAIEQTGEQNDPWDVRPDAARLRVPTHVIASDPAVDSILHGAVADQVLQNPAVTMSVITGAGHSPHRDKPDETMAELLAVLAGERVLR